MNAWAVQIRHARLALDWETEAEVTTSDEAFALARAHRADGYEARCRKWCPACGQYRTSYLGDRCVECRQIAASFEEGKK